MFTKNQFLAYLRDLKVPVDSKGKIVKAEVMRVFGGTYREPEWIQLSDYKVRLPETYIPSIEKDEAILNRLVFNESIMVTRYGTFLTKLGDEVILDGVVYHYVLKSNPRNVHYGFRVFLAGVPVTGGSGIQGLSAAQAQCNSKAAYLIEKELFDL
jgi:hypothetical protein